MKINIDSLIESLPMVCPNLNGYKASFDFYFCPWSNYYGWMDNNNVQETVANTLGDRWTFFFEGAQVKSDITDSSDALSVIDECSVKPGTLMDYLGYPPGFAGRQLDDAGGYAFEGMLLPAEKLLSVIDIYRNYYCNQQEGKAYFVSVPDSGIPGIDAQFMDKYTLEPIALEDLDQITKILRLNSPGVSIDEALDDWPLHLQYVGMTTLGDFVRKLIRSCCVAPLAGLPVRTYRMDLNRGLLKITESQYTSRVNVSNNSFSIDTLRFANKMQKLLDRIDVSGGRFSDMMRARWGVTPRNTLNVPDYLGSVSNFFGITDVVATASGMNNELDGRGNSVLGQQAGFAVGKVKRDNAPISFRSDQYGTLVCMFSLVPIVTYSQGIEKEDLKTSFAEVFDPAFNQVGYQDVSPLELNALPIFRYTSDVVDSGTSLGQPYTLSQTSVGRRFAWSEYMSSLPRAHGLFAYGQDFDYWVNNRLYLNRIDNTIDTQDFPEGVKLMPYGEVDLSTYINPAYQNHLFADVSRFAQNFRLRVNFDVFMRRNIGSRVMPHL